MPNKSPGDKCCVVGCKNNSLNSPDTKFYSFSVRPHKSEQRKKWIKAIGRQNIDGTLWQPNKRSRICSRHFIGNKKSEHPFSPNFVPTIFPSQYYERSKISKNALKQQQTDRFERAKKREESYHTKRPRLKKNAVPSENLPTFTVRSNNKRTTSLKKNGCETMGECNEHVHELRPTASVCVEANESFLKHRCKETSTDPVASAEKSVQVSIRVPCRNQTVQTFTVLPFKPF